MESIAALDGVEEAAAEICAAEEEFKRMNAFFSARAAKKGGDGSRAFGKEEDAPLKCRLAKVNQSVCATEPDGLSDPLVRLVKVYCASLCFPLAVAK